MPASSHAQPDPGGSFSSENGPQVVVRAGEYFVCSACGTMVRLPAEVVGQLVLTAAPTPEKQPVAATPEREEPARSMPHAAVSPQADQVSVKATATVRRPSKARPSRPRRPQQPQRVSLAGEMIDGLRVPSGDELDRALAWVSFHLRVLDRQGSEIARLQKLLKEQAADKGRSPLPHTDVENACQEQTQAPSDLPRAPHAQEDLGVVPEADHKSERDANERGPP